MKASIKTQRGFTLLELIVAISILVIVAVLSWRGLDSVLHTRDSLNDSQTRSDAMQRSFNRIERDALLAQAVELFEGGRVRLWAANATAVEYQWRNGQLQRRVLAPDGSVQEQQVLLGELSGLQAEIYQRSVVGNNSGNDSGNGVWSAAPTSQGNPGEGDMMRAQPVGPPVPASGAAPAPVMNGDPAASPFPSPVPGMASPPSPANTNPVNPGRSNPSGNTLTGLRLRLNLQQGGVIERVFLLGASS